MDIFNIKKIVFRIEKKILTYILLHISIFETRTSIKILYTIIENVRTSYIGRYKLRTAHFRDYLVSIYTLMNANYIHKFYRVSRHTLFWKHTAELQ